MTNEHALVLYALVHRLAERGNLRFEDQAEERALWDLEAELERTLTEVLRADYQVLLDAARDRLRDQE